MTITDDMVQAFADAKQAAHSGDGGDASPEGSADAGGSVEAQGDDDAGGVGGSQGEAAGGDPTDGGAPDSTTPTSEAPEPPAGELVDGTEDSEAPGAVPTEPVAAAAYWQAKAETAEQRRRDMQSMKDRELAEHKVKIEALEQLWATEDAEYEQQQAQAAQLGALPVGDALDEMVQFAPVDQFTAALQTGDHGRITEVIASLHRVHGAEAGVWAQNAYQQAVIQAQLAQQQQEMEAYKASLEAPAKQQAEFQQAVTAVREKYGAEAMQSVAPRVRELILQNYAAEKDRYASKDAFVEAQYLRAYHEHTLAVAQQTAAAPAPVAHVEAGGGARVETPEPTYAELKTKKLLEAAQQGRVYG